MVKENWKKKYEDLKNNFDRLDRHNDVLYRLFVAARKLRNNGHDRDIIAEASQELFAAIGDVENFERNLKND
jgi:hypothetical protein